MTRFPNGRSLRRNRLLKFGRLSRPGARLPQHGADPALLLNRAADLLFDHSLFNGHPRFWGYITSSAAPIGALGDLLAAAVNPNVGAWLLSPMASEIEAQTIRWIAEMLGYPVDCGGLFVSGGNMANIVCFLAARQAKAGWDVRTKGMDGARLRAYCSKETHTWIQKAADIAVWAPMPCAGFRRMMKCGSDLPRLARANSRDIDAGDRPHLSLEMPVPSAPARLTPCRNWQHFAANLISGSTWTELTAALLPSCPMLPLRSAALREADSVGRRSA